VYLDWGLPSRRAIRRVPPRLLDPALFANGSMGPKVEAAVEFAARTGKAPACMDTYIGPNIYCYCAWFDICLDKFDNFRLPNMLRR
jgi:hypothetical protein